MEKEVLLEFGGTKRVEVEKKLVLEQPASIEKPLLNTYQSLCVPNLMVDVSNYLTEILLSKKKRKMPPVAFWTKEYKGQYDALVREYILELTQIKKLLKVFSPCVLVEYFRGKEYKTVRFLKLEEQKALVYDLFKAQLNYLSSLSISKKELEKVDDKLEYIEKKVAAKSTRIGKGL